MWFKDASKELAGELSRLLSQLIAEQATDVPAHTGLQRHPQLLSVVQQLTRHWQEHTQFRHQARAIEEGREPNNYIEPEKVSASERHNLKEAFQVLSNAQKFLRFRYPAQAGQAL